MPEVIEKIQQKTPEITKPKQIKKPDNHVIDVYIENLPGQERLVAHMATNEKITVRELQPSELFQIIEAKEKEKLAGKTDLELLEEAWLLNDTSRIISEKISEIDLYLKNFGNHILVADFETITDERIPPAERHFLVEPNKVEKIKNKFQELDGYSLTTVEYSNGELALVVEGDITLVFIYAREKKIKEKEQKTETITLQELEKRMVDEILKLAKQENTKKTDDDIAEKIIEIFEEYEKKFKYRKEGRRFEKIINSLDPEQNTPLAQSLNETTQTRLIMAIAQFRMDQEDRRDERGFVGVGMGDVYR